MIVEVASIAALLLGTYGALHFSDYMASVFIGKFGMSSEYTPVISFGVTFLLIVILVYIVSRLINKLVEKVALGLVNKILGAAFGIAKFTLILSIAFTIFNKADEKATLISKETKDKSLLYNPLSKVSMYIFPMLEAFKPSDAQIDEVKSKIDTEKKK